jgi:hypothetical protein
MTAVKRRRTRSTVLAAVAAFAGFLAVLVLGVTGVQSLRESTAGQQAAGQADAVPAQRLPFTSTALVGVVDEELRLTSVAVWVLDPSGVGGSIAGLAAPADSASGTFDKLSPLAAVYEVDGSEEFLAAAERLTGLTFDVVEVVDEQRFAQIIAPLGDLPVLFPVPFADASSGEAWEAGEATLASPAAARAITATDPSIADWYFESVRAAVWQAIADRVGAGVGSIAPSASDVDVPVPEGLGEFAERLFAAPVEFRAVEFVAIDPDRVATQLPDRYVGVLGPVDSVVAHDRADMTILFGATAPGRLGAPLDAPVFRVVASFTEADLEPLGLNQTDVLKRAIDRLFFAQANIVSVADVIGGPVPEVTLLEVADAEVIDAVRAVYEPLFGEIEVVEAAVRIDGIDIEVILGRTFLDEVRGETAADVAGFGGDDDGDASDE